MKAERKTAGALRLVVIMLLLALLTAALPACAAAEEEEDLRQPDLFYILESIGEDVVWRGMGIPLLDGVVITAPSCLPEDPKNTLLTDGWNLWKAGAVLPDTTGTLVTVLFEPGDTLPRTGSYTLEAAEASVWDSFVQTADSEMSRMNRGIVNAAPVTWRGNSSILLTLTGPAEPGAALLSEAGRLLGMVTAQYAEGDNRVIAVDADEILRAAREALGVMNQMPAGEALPPEGLRVTAEDNLVTFDWSEAVLPEPPEGQAHYLVVADEANSYLTYVPLGGDFTAMNMLLTPGRTYLSGFITSDHTPDEVPASHVRTVLPQAELLTDHGFRSLACSLAEDRGGAEPVPVSEATEEFLRSGRAVFYSVSAYEITGEESDTLLITLTDPNGNNYRYASEWLYGEEYAQRDMWFVPLQDTGLLNVTPDEALPKGVYELAYYVGGKLADRAWFELK